MLTRLCVVAAVIFSWQAAQAGEWWFSLRGGPSVPRLHNGGNEVSKDYKSIVAPNVGVGAEYKFSDSLSVVIEADYSGQGGERKGVQPITMVPDGMLPRGTYLYADFDNRSELDYIEIPVMVRYDRLLSDKWHYFVEGGGYFGYLLRAKQKTSGSGQIYADAGRTQTTYEGFPLPSVSFDTSTDVLDELNRVNWGVTAGAGIGYELSAEGRLFFDVRGEYGLASLQKDKINGESSTGCAIFLLGYSHSL